MLSDGLKLEFRYQRLDSSLNHQVRRCVSKYATPEAYSAVWSLFGKLYCCLIGEYVLLPLFGNSRPPEGTEKGPLHNMGGPKRGHCTIW